MHPVPPGAGTRVRSWNGIFHTNRHYTVEKEREKERENSCKKKMEGRKKERKGREKEREREIK